MFRRSSRRRVGCHARLLVVQRADAPVDHRGRRRLAEVMTQGAEHDGDHLRPGEVGIQRARLVDDHQRVHPDVPFRVPLRFLRAAGKGLQLG